MATAFKLNDLYSLIEPQIDLVRSNVRRHWVEAFQLVYGASVTPPRLGGKMLRPALCFLSAGAAGAEDLDHFVEMGTAMELLHLAALAHDDVIDRADTRRGQTSLNALWDNHTAVLGGDYMVARALTILTTYDSCPVISSALESIHQMAEGEMINFGREKGGLDEQDCLRLARKKTASLFSVACSTPTLLLDDHHQKALAEFGMGLGTAFQLVDDLLDLEQDESALGKPSCGDITEGKTTLPILYMREALNEEDKARLEGLTGSPLPETERIWVMEALRESGAQSRVEALAQQSITEAQTALDTLPTNQFTDAMRSVAKFVLVRDC